MISDSYNLLNPRVGEAVRPGKRIREGILLGLANAEVSSPGHTQGIFGFAKQGDKVTLMHKIPKHIITLSCSLAS